ncbi:MAG: YciI family protein [Terricaulis sp.]
MRVMVFHKASEDSAMDGPPTPEQLEAFAAMNRFTEELVQAGVFVAAAGLKNTADAKRIVFEGADRTVFDGPFAETKELIAGFSIWEVKDMDEALAWVKRAPNDAMPGKSVVEIRPFYEAADPRRIHDPGRTRSAPRGRAGETGRRLRPAASLEREVSGQFGPKSISDPTRFASSKRHRLLRSMRLVRFELRCHWSGVLCHPR